jgi:hypothetical protein
VGKLLKDAAAAKARFALILSDDKTELKDLGSGEQKAVELASVIEAVRGR